MPWFSGDTALNAYILAWDQHALLRQPVHLFDANFLYPTRDTLALSENLLGAAILAFPLTLFQNPLLVYNILFFASFALSGFAWFVVLRRWGLGWFAAWIGGMAFGFLPWRWGQVGHAQLLYTWWIPIALGGAENWMRRGGWGSIMLTAFSLVASLYTCVYDALFLLCFLGVFVTVGLCANPGILTLRRDGLAQFAIGVLLFALFLLPAFASYHRIKSVLGTPNTIKDVIPRGASFGDYLRPSSFNLIWGARKPVPPNPYSDVPWEHELFPGFALMALAASYPWTWWLRRKTQSEKPAPQTRLALMLVGGGLALLIVSLGPRLHWFGHGTRVALPFAWLYKFVPGFSAIRVPCRAGLFVGFALSGLAALALDGWLNLPEKILRWTGRLVAVPLALALLAELGVHPLPMEENPDYSRHRQVQREIARRAPGTVLVLPIEDRLNYLAPLTTAVHFYPLVNGVSGYLPHKNGDIFDAFRADVWGDTQAHLLRKMRVRHVVLDHRKSANPSPEVLKRLDETLARLGFDVETAYFPQSDITLLEIKPTEGENPKS